MAVPQCWLSLNGGWLAASRGRTMNDKTNPPKNSGTTRKNRLADKRRAGEADQRPDGLGAAKEMQKD
ncbi:MAG: hypothetical protein E5V51_09130 [Mesorhizobium sp.]|nr:MAG: hypothetical protein E5V51_09130 [Mesorhizobium sp.]